MPFRVRHLSVLPIFAMASPFLAMAQSNSSATISGVVTDSLGAALARANVSLHSVDNKVDRRTVTDASGHFSLSGLAPTTYEIDADAAGFAVTKKPNVQVIAGQTLDLSLGLKVSDINQQVTVEADASTSVAAQLAPLDSRLDERSARTEIMDHYIQNFTSPVSDFSEIIQNAPGAFSINSNGVGLGDSKTYFRGFSDGNYDITFDGIPFEDTNSPTHHSWAFFPTPLIGGVDFDRSPGDAATIGPTPFGGSINLLSRNLSNSFNVRGGVSYGSFNTILTNVELDSGKLGANGKTRVSADFNHLTSDGFQSFNAQQRSAGGIKVQYDFSDEKVLTGFSGVVLLDTNTPNTKGPTRTQYQAQYNYLLQNTDPTRSDYVGYNYYHIPTDFEYVGYKTPLGASWHLDTKQYTYSYYNQQNYALTPKTGIISVANCAPEGKQSCGVDKLNSYRKYGDISTFSEVSKYGIFRAGLWYEWATTSRHQIPQDPISLADSVLPNFNEKFITTTYQPFAEYEFHPTTRLAITGGLKFAHYGFGLTQYSDNGGAIGTLPNGTASVYHSVGFNAYMPSADVNYRIRENWSIYGQFATGSIVPPSSVFDVPNVTTVGGVTTIIPNPVSVTPGLSYAKSYQAGSVAKLHRITLSGDVFYVRYGNAYTASPDPNAVGAQEYQSSGDSGTKGFEGDTNIALLPGLSIYLNGTVGADRYLSSTIAQGAKTYNNPNNGLWVANTPANTETYGITYQRKGMDFGFFTKRIGPMWNDNKATVPLAYTDGTSANTSITANQVIPIDPFDVSNLFFNYTVRNNSRLDNTKIRLSFNNLFDARNITSVTAANTGTTFTPAGGDTLGLLPARPARAYPTAPQGRVSRLGAASLLARFVSSNQTRFHAQALISPGADPCSSLLCFSPLCGGSDCAVNGHTRTEASHCLSLSAVDAASL